MESVQRLKFLTTGQDPNGTIPLPKEKEAQIPDRTLAE
jgi:hypothetical protein